jgi:hypothetical protein
MLVSGEVYFSLVFFFTIKSTQWGIKVKYFFIILSCGQLNLGPQFTIWNFKKASHEFKIIFLFSLNR